MLLEGIRHEITGSGTWASTRSAAVRSAADYVEDFPYHLPEAVVLQNVTTTSGKPVRLSPNKRMFRTVKLVTASSGDVGP